MKTILAILVRAILSWWRERALNAAYEEAIRENERFDQHIREAEAFKRTTKAVLDERPALPDDVIAVRERLRERAKRNSTASK